MNEGVELIIMNAVMATMLMDVCVFYGVRRCGGVAFSPPKGHLLAIWQQWRYKPEDVLLAPDEIWRELAGASLWRVFSGVENKST